MAKVNKVVLAYSGGLDTSIILKWLQEEYRCEVVTFTADIGQGEEVEPARNKAEQMGVNDNIQHPKERFPLRPLAFRGDSNYTHSAFVAEQTMSFIGQHRDSPFLCISGFYSPHSPWVAPQEFIDIYEPNTLTIPKYPEHIENQRNSSSFTQEELRRAHHGSVSYTHLTLPTNREV